MTHHGLRHTYAARTYQELIGKGVSPSDAHYQVSRLLGRDMREVGHTRWAGRNLCDIFFAFPLTSGDACGIFLA